MYIAECLISPQWEENVPELRFLRPVNKHVGNDPKFKPGNILIPCSRRMKLITANI